MKPGIFALFASMASHWIILRRSANSDALQTDRRTLLEGRFYLPPEPAYEYKNNHYNKKRDAEDIFTASHIRRSWFPRH
jgi:hypothetical protein